jgi:hypothetical protein
VFLLLKGVCHDQSYLEMELCFNGVAARLCDQLVDGVSRRVYPCGYCGRSFVGVIVEEIRNPHNQVPGYGVPTPPQPYYRQP